MSEILGPVEDDPRFHEALRLFNLREYAEAADLFEELFFEAVRDEVDFVRVFLQIATAAHHAERGDWTAARERAEEGLRVAERVRDWRGVDTNVLVSTSKAFVASITGSNTSVEWPLAKIPGDAAG